MSSTLRAAIAAFGATTKAKLANLAATGEPEEQLRAPLEELVVDIADLDAASYLLYNTLVHV
jgi:hypothetical protein